MKQLATTERQTAVQTAVKELPGWIQYLIGAFPQQRPNAMTYAVLESQFQEDGAGVMLDAVKDYVTENKFWPASARVDDAFGDRNLMCSCAPIDEYRKSLYEFDEISK